MDDMQKTSFQEIGEKVMILLLVVLEYMTHNMGRVGPIGFFTEF